jgi:DNA-binding winged helix-turn-helix (wHTH) protein/predicted ATPase
MPPDPPLHFGPYRLDGPSGPLWHEAALVALPPKAVAVLWQLVSQAGQVVSKATLLDTVWAETVVSEGTLATCLSLLRHALGEDARQPRYIATVHRFGYRFVAPVTHEGPPTSLEPPPLLVGRAAELAQLHACFAQARQGGRQTVFVTGEAGMGKTTLVDAFLAEVAAAQTAWIGRGQCIEHYGAGEAYLPLLDALGRLGRGRDGARLVACLRQYAPTWLGQLSAVVGEEREAFGHQRHGGTPRQMLRELAEALEACTAAHPLIVVLEDLHWSDASTVEALAWLARRREAARLLVLGTYRPVELILRQHPLKAGKQELQLHGHCAEVPLGYLPMAAVQAYLAQCGPAVAVTAAWATWVHRRTEGHPLFMVHVVEELARGGRLTAAPATAAAGRGAAVEVPASLQQLIELQLGQLDAEEQQVLEVASVVGSEFTEASLAAGLPLPHDAIAASCEGLARRGQFIEDRGLAVWPDGTVSGQYSFRHTLYQEVLYGRIGSGRRMRCHRALGMRLEEAYGAQVSQIAATLAVHFERGGDPGRAVRYRQRAADTALGRYAYPEAMGHLTQGLALLQQLPETPARAQQELDLLLALGPALMATTGPGAPEVDQTYARARALCTQVGESPQLFPTLRGLWRFYLNRGPLQTARELGEQLVRLAQGAAAPTALPEAHAALGTTLFYVGEYVSALTHLEQGFTRTAVTAQRALGLRHGEAPGVRGLALAAWALWCLGFPTQALRRGEEAQAQAQACAQPYSLAMAQHWMIYVHYRRREVAAVQTQAEALLSLATAQQFPLYVEHVTYWRGWALAIQGQGERGIGQLRQGMAGVVATGQTLARPLCLLLLAEALAHTGQVDEGLRVMAEALVAIEASGRYELLAEAYQLHGALLLRQAGSGTHQAEACFQQALAIARRQQAKSWELRAAMSLSRLWQQQGKRAEARALLAPIYGWFTEGFDTADLQEAKALLEALGEGEASRHALAALPYKTDKAPG